MKTFEIHFTGRRLGAIGVFYPIHAEVFAEDDVGALAALYERFEHVQYPQVKEIASPFDSDGLVERVQNERDEFNQIRGLALVLRGFIDKVAERQAKANQDWHDDPEAPDWGLYHATAEVQFPRAARDAAILELVSRHLEVLNENEAAAERKAVKA